MPDLQTQMALLRQRIARIDRKYADGAPAPEPTATPQPSRLEEILNGREVETPLGRHFETERCWERHRRHGSVDISELAELPADLLDAISGGEVPAADCRRWAFLDTETTGLAGGSGTYAFLIGVGHATERGFYLRQFFLREPGEERSQLHALKEYLAQFDTLVTYNGRAFDQPLLETRFRMSRLAPPFSSLAHLDLLYGARRLWKLCFESCRLVELEQRILGVMREGDLPGELIPYVYFEYLRTREALRLVPILHHNAIDILTLACLTAIVPVAFGELDGKSANGHQRWRVRHGAEMVGLARWLRDAGRLEDALDLMRRAIDAGLRDELLFRTMWDVGAMEKRLGREAAAIAMFSELSSARNPFRAQALEELAKHYEHRERNYRMALECTLAAQNIESSPELRHRAARLERKLAAGRAVRRLL